MRRASLLAVPACLAVVLAGCGGGGGGTTAATRTEAAPPPTPPPPRTTARPATRASVVTVRAIDGDTGKSLPAAAISVRGATRRSRVTFAMRPRRLAVVNLWAPGYAPRSIPVPFAQQRAAVLRLYRRDTQWPMYGADAARTQAQTG